MNVSSAVVKVKEGQLESVKLKLHEVENCEVHISEGQKIIIVIEAKSIDEEVACIRKIERLEGVLAAQVVYSYSETELEKEREKIEFAPDQPQWLNDESVKAESITYHGDLRKDKKKHV